MKVLVFSQVPPPVHGSTLATQTLISELRKLGADVDLLDRRFSASVAQVGRRNPRKVLAALSLMLRSVRKLRSKPDVVVFFGTNRPGSFAVDLAVMSLMRLARVPVIQYIHTVGFNRLAGSSPIVARLVAWFLRVEVVVCLSDMVAADVRPSLGRRSRISIIPNAISPLTKDLQAADPPEFVFLANLIPEKGALDIVQVARECERLGIRAHFAIYGHDSDPAYKATLMSAAGSTHNLRIGGPVVGDVEKSRVLARARALLYPSRYPYEAQPLAIIEAMSVGTPTIAYPAGGIPEIVLDGVSGYLVEGPSGMTDAIRRDALGERKLPDRGTTEAQFQRMHGLAEYSNRWRILLESVTGGRG
ncbi:glycosyltransferase family 4 protein [Microbacterium marinum]|uniref:glycosyltransferase family 4 protein n=1 Tax=Microbacterium marinum TaxID=421115 RepID=UPI00385015F1